MSRSSRLVINFNLQSITFLDAENQRKAKCTVSAFKKFLDQKKGENYHTRNRVKTIKFTHNRVLKVMRHPVRLK